MHRLKLIGLLVFLVTGLSLASYMVVRNDFGPRIEQSVADDLAKTQLQVQALRFARTERLKKLAAWLADEPRLSLARALREATDEARHKLAADALTQIRPLLQEKQRLDYMPDVMLVTSPAGKVLARYRFDNLWGETLSFPLLRRVADARMRDDDVWKFREQNERMMTVVAAPILDGAQLAGTLSLLYEHSNQAAQEDRKVYKSEIAYFLDGTVYGSSLAEPAQTKQLLDFITPHRQALDAGKLVGPSALDVDGKKYVALAAGHTDRPGGFVLLRSLDDALAPVSAFLGRFPLIAGGFLLVASLLALLLLRSLTAPYDRLEHEVMEMAAGHHDRAFDATIGGGAGALAHHLNQLVAHLTGQPAPGEGEDTGWHTDPFFVEELPGKTGKGAKWQPLAQHKKDLDAKNTLTRAYYERLFDDYQRARQKLGDKGADGVTLERFMEKVRKSEEPLRTKYACPVVKFEVNVKDGKVTLKPVPLR